jgi:phenylalanyl-tRNA synthetase beta chain
MLETIKHNSNRQNRNLKLFEFGNSYSLDKENYHENKRLNIAITGNVFEENWITDYKENNFYYLKGVSKNLLEKLNISNVKYELVEDDIFKSKLKILYNKKEVGFIGELDKDYIQEFSIEQDIHILNLDLDKIRLKTFNNKFEELSKFPSSRRDLSMILDNNIKFEEIESIAYGLEGKILKDVVLFDEFKGKNIGDDKKSFAVSFTFNDSKKTLTDKIIDKIMTRFADTYKLELGAVIRDK